METYLLLFRGVNVGGKNSLPMKDLVTLLELNGYKNVKSYIQSGNVILQSIKRPVELNVTSLIHDNFGFTPEVICLSKSELDNVIESNPFASVEGNKAHFYFCKSTPNLNVEKLQKYLSDSEQYSVAGNVFYLSAPAGIGRSKLVANIEVCLGAAATGRNLNSVLRLQQMMR